MTDAHDKGQETPQEAAAAHRPWTAPMATEARLADAASLDQAGDDGFGILTAS